MPAKSFQVPVTQGDLRKEESILQLLDGLQKLDEVANTVFNNIGARVAKNQESLVGINNRVNVARAKVQKLIGTRNATQIFSSAKYPGQEAELKPYQPIHLGSNVPVVRPNHPVEERFTKLRDKDIKDKLQFFNIDMKARRLRDKAITEDEESCEGLGGLPKNVASVSGMLLFNTSENPYKKYVTIDPLLGAVSKTRDDIDQEAGIFAAPETLLRGDRYTAVEAETFIYKPAIGAVPLIETPAVLPDLFGVADISFSADVGGGIAPSGAPGAGALPDLPEVAPAAADMPPDITSGGAPAATDAGAPPPPPPPAPSAAAPPPPPPPPAPAAAPPPPPPPGPPAPDAAAPAAPRPPSPPDDGSGRGGLLADIRKGHKNRLKNKKDKRQRKLEKKEKKENTSSGGGDLMSSLADRLKRRRAAVSGGGKKEKKKAESDDEEDFKPRKSSGSLMDTLKDMMPQSKLGSDDGSGDDWVDDDHSDDD